jgi:hypothetical protein
MYQTRKYRPNLPRLNNHNPRLIAQNDIKPNMTKLNPSLAWQARPPEEHGRILLHYEEHTPPPTNRDMMEIMGEKIQLLITPFSL